MKLDGDDFELFGLPRRFALDRRDLDSRWRTLQSEVHPDRFAAEGVTAQRRSMQWAVRVNDAYRRLKDPVARAITLCQLAGENVDVHDNAVMPRTFLSQQMHWREALAEARETQTIRDLERDVLAQARALEEQLRVELDERADAPAAAQTVRALMFVSRFRSDVDQRLESLQT